MTDNNNANLNAAAENSGSPGMDISERPTVDTRNLITGSEGIAEEGSAKPKSFSDLDSILLPRNKGDGEGTKQGSKKKSSQKDEDEEFDEEDLDDDLEGDDEDDDLDDLEEDDDLEGVSEEDEAEEEDEDETDSEEDEEGSEGSSTDAYDKKVIKVKVNGKWREFTGKQMKDMVASGAHLKEQRDEFNQEVHRFKQDFDTSKAKLEEADRILSPIVQAATKGNPEEAVIKAFELKGVNKVQAKWTLIDRMIPVVSDILGLDMNLVKSRIQERQEYIRQAQLKDENDFYKEQVSKKEEDPQKDEDKAAEREINQFMEEHDVTRKQLRTAVSWLKENTYKGKEDEISLPVIGDFIKVKRAIEKAETAIASIRPKLLRDADFFDQTVNLAKKRPDWGADKIARWVEKKARSLKKNQQDDQVNELRKDVSRKVLKANNKAALNKATPSSQKKPKTFSDLSGDSDLLNI